MAAGPFTVLDVAQAALGAAIDLSADGLSLILLDNSQALDETFVGASGDGLYADLTGELATAGGYTVGGQALTGVAWSTTGGVTTLAADPVVWPAATLTAKYAAIIDTTVAGDPIVGFADLDEADPAGRSAAGVDFTVSWPSGIFTLAKAP